MLFSTPLFLFWFLPIVLLIYVLLPGIRARNTWLLLASLVFYAWGEPGFILMLLLSALVNYVIGRAMERGPAPARRKGIAALGIIINIGLLLFFKYANLAVDNLNVLLQALGSKPVPAINIPLPLGISFFTFHSLSYIIDVYRNEALYQKK